MKDPRKEKNRELRRIARSRHNPSIYCLFDKYHPALKKLVEDARLQYRADHKRLWYWRDVEYLYYTDLKYEWVTKIAGYWNALGGAPPSDYRRLLNRQRRARQKAAMRDAWHNDDWDDFMLPRDRRTVRWEYW